MLDAPTTPLDGRNPTAVYFGQRINVACQSQRFGLREHLFSQPSQSFLLSCSPTPRLFWEILVAGGELVCIHATKHQESPPSWAFASGTNWQWEDPHKVPIKELSRRRC